MTSLKLRGYCWMELTALAVVLTLPGHSQAAQDTPRTSSPPPPRFVPTPEQLAIQAASQKDHQRVMDELGIKDLRPPVSGDPNAPNHANFDEAKADVYPKIPDPLVLNNGKRV